MGRRFFAAEQIADIRAYARDYMFRTAETFVAPPVTEGGWGPGAQNSFPWLQTEYRWRHTLQVARYAADIADHEGLDASVLETAGLFHDVAYFSSPWTDHAQAGAAVCRKYLERGGVAQEITETVAGAVLDHAGKKPNGYLDGRPIESKVLIEADFLDKVGPNGVLAWALNCGSLGRTQVECLDGVYRFQIRRAEETIPRLWTGRARELAVEKLSLVKGFIRMLEEEIIRDV